MGQPLGVRLHLGLCPSDEPLPEAEQMIPLVLDEVLREIETAIEELRPAVVADLRWGGESAHNIRQRLERARVLLARFGQEGEGRG